ncbi:MAG: hypothetical protein HY674_01370 [Chloroflexi bacterium]|nr:hypothetical protein [Chloroflexota bacterium]
MKLTATSLAFRVVLIWLGSSLGLRGEPELPVPAEDRDSSRKEATVQFSNDERGTPVALVNNKVRVFFKDLKERAETQKIDGVDFSSGGAEPSFVMGAGNLGMIVSLDGVQDWKARVPKRHRAVFFVDADRTFVDIQAPAGNKEPILLEFPDGARAEVKPDSMVRFDFFKDQSYYLAGAEQTPATSAEGQSLTLTPFFPPLLGGPLVEKRETNGTSRLTRLTPLTAVVISGQADNEVNVSVGRQNVELLLGSRQQVRLGNGSVLDLYLNPVTKTLDWHVVKGAFRFTIAGLDCWKALGLTGQAGSQQWEVTGQLIDLRNLPGTETNRVGKNILVNLAARINAVVPPKSTFQYGRIGDCTTFATAALGDEVLVYNDGTKVVTHLEANNVLFRSGSPLGPGQTIAKDFKQSLMLEWETEAFLRLKSAASVLTVDQDSKKTFQSPDGGEVEVNYMQHGELTLRVLAGEYVVQPEFLQNLRIEVAQGEGLSLTWDRRTGMFTIQASKENVPSSQVKVVTPEGYSPLLSPQSKLTFFTARNLFMPTTTGANMIFYEAAGSGDAQAFGLSPVSRPAPTGRGSTTVFGTSDQIDPSRILQPPVSVVQ